MCLFSPLRDCSIYITVLQLKRNQNFWLYVHFFFFFNDHMGCVTFSIAVQFLSVFIVSVCVYVFVYEYVGVGFFFIFGFSPVVKIVAAEAVEPKRKLLCHSIRNTSLKQVAYGLSDRSWVTEGHVSKYSTIK